MKFQKTSSFQTIKADILQRIRDRYWDLGATIPNEEALAKNYGCSRVTVNRALRELADAGIVERRRKTGTRVVRQPVRAASLVIPIIRNDIENRGATYRYALLEREQQPAPPAILAKMGLAKMALGEAREVLHVRCLHFADGSPYQYEDRWINLMAAPKAAEEAFEDISPNEWLVMREPFSDAEHMFSAQSATAEQAALLELSQGDPLFVIERRTWSPEQTITSVKLYHPGATFKMVSRS